MLLSTLRAARRRTGLLLAGGLALTLTATAQTSTAPSWAWARGLHGPGSEFFNAVAADAAGNAYAVGGYERTVAVGGTSLTSRGELDVVVAKYDAAGNALWVRSFGSSLDDYAAQVAVDAAGNTYVTGFFSATVAFGSVTLSTGPNGAGVFVLKLDAQGNVLWAQKGTSSNFAFGAGVQPDGSGGAYLFASYTDDFYLGGASFTGFGSVLARLDAQGAVQWVRQQSSKATGYPDQFTANALAVGGGYLYAAGSFAGTVTVGGTTLTAPGSTDAWVASYDAQGNQRWVRQGGNPTGYDVVQGLAVDASGQVYVSGEFAGAATFGSLSLPGHGNTADALLFKFDAQGNGLWARQLGGSGQDYGYGLVLDAQGNVYQAGGCQAGAEVAGLPLPNRGDVDAFVVSYTGQGVLRWAQTAGGPGEDLALSLGAPDGAGGMVVGGAFGGTTASFGATTLTNQGPVSPYVYDGFVARLSGVVSAVRPGGSLAPISAHPNPAADRVRLAGLPAGCAVQLLDGLGRVVRTAPAAELSVRGLPAGLYSLRATDAAGRQYGGRLVVE